MKEKTIEISEGEFKEYQDLKRKSKELNKFEEVYNEIGEQLKGALEDVKKRQIRRVA
ncbi:hypothetical protein HYX16_05660 [Candidatus Woesearchaeota archaeon]|nr:hypothetical protein [Candidatus Woesearchaeota archaeon]